MNILTVLAIPVVILAVSCSHMNQTTPLEGQTQKVSVTPLPEATVAAEAEKEEQELDKEILEIEKLISKRLDTKPVEEDSSVPESAPVEINERVKTWLNYFTTKERERFQLYLTRGERYRDLIFRVLDDNNAPRELYYLAMIESGFANHAVSRARAVGIWQFMRGTAIQYGLEVNQWVDERRDPTKATEAAVRYLKDLYNVFGSWYLAMAAYNCGEHRIVRTIMKGKTRDFWVLAETGLLPRETMNYIPKLFAALMIGMNPGNYGFEKQEALPKWNYAKLKIPGPVHLKSVARITGNSLTELRKMNPELRSNYTPRNRGTYEINIMKESKDTLESSLPLLATKKIRKLKYPSYAYTTVYRVRRGDTLSTIAEKFRLSLRSLKRLNGIRGSRIYAGQRLRISSRPAKSLPTRTRGHHYYRVRRGDSLISIARHYGTTVYRLKKLNGLRSNRIIAGQRLKVTRDSQVSHYRGNGKYYMVKHGDNLTSIARKTRLSVSRIKQLNGIRKNRIYAGQKLRLK